MKWKREFEIAFVGLKPGEHHFTYNIEDSFFEQFAKQDFDQAQIEVKMTLDKQVNFFLLHFDIHGQANTLCDRCGDTMTMTIWDEFDHVIKLVATDDVENNDDGDPEVTYISQSDSLLDVSKLVYEYCIFAQPIQKVHSDSIKGESGCNQETLNILNKQGEHTSNKMWDALKKQIEKKN
jgi:uncharacterized metal-binding protein YceD (DUF177 family)